MTAAFSALLISVQVGKTPAGRSDLHSSIMVFPVRQQIPTSVWGRFRIISDGHTTEQLIGSAAASMKSDGPRSASTMTISSMPPTATVIYGFLPIGEQVSQSQETFPDMKRGSLHGIHHFFFPMPTIMCSILAGIESGDRIMKVQAFLL